MGFFNNNRRWCFRSDYVLNLPDGILTSILKDYSWSRMSVPGNLETAGQYGIYTLPEDFDKCDGTITIMVNQCINETKAQQEMMKKHIEIIKAELSIPVEFDIKKDEETSIIAEIIEFKEKLLSICKRRST